MTRARLRIFLVPNATWLGTGVLLTFLSSFGQTFFISVFAGEIRATYGLSHGAWGGLYSLGTTVSAIVMIWAGGLTDIYRVRVLGPVVLGGLTLAALAMALNTVLFLLPVVIFLLRLFGQGMSTHLAQVAMARWFTTTRGKALSIASLGYSVGEALLPVIFVAAMAFIDWRLLWVVAAGVTVLGIPVLIRLLRQERTPQSLSGDHIATGMQNHHWTRREALCHPLFWFMAPAILAPSAFITAFFFHQVHLAQVRDWPHIQLVALFPVFTGVSILSMFAAGWALDRWGTARIMPYYQLPMGVGFAILSVTDTVTGALIGLTFLALTVGAHNTLPSAFWAEFYGTRHIGAIKAMATAVMVLGSAVGPALTGALIDHHVTLGTQFMWIAGFFGLVCVLVWFGIHRAKAAF
ncbi:phosphoglycerate transporter family protein [Ruegeria denitrificans]|uniref:Phosphoglycerate transporter family protein n=1 Tax=Ruegeria denitrificans TaxID=1715692 RepID=A0A0P1IHT9_9RHOB|nr:MFS transporter [Ruegeria denitrificans]CUK13836.1 phosphoglycerate transporter family protein [Ruegeria denitrificans]